MRRGRFAEGQDIGVLHEHQAGVKTAELRRKHCISDADALHLEGEMLQLPVSGSAPRRALEDENRRQ